MAVSFPVKDECIDQHIPRQHHDTEYDSKLIRQTAGIDQRRNVMLDKSTFVPRLPCCNPVRVLKRRQRANLAEEIDGRRPEHHGYMQPCHQWPVQDYQPSENGKQNKCEMHQ